ncbi:hypothetical protein CFD26_100415 [Aspergillus turcosus]|uniref:Uncharacterized protein n=1 Tax=Aspergillus turcosus TaxID=1245748 RepID=A0A421CST8_9EURO|nr:hypothetical protein CFD26_100415 [Aspergillus turcosus]
MSRGSRARPLLDTPNTVDSLDDPTKGACAGRSRVETTAGMGDCPQRRPAWQGRNGRREGFQATRGDPALAFHIEPPTSTGPQSCVQTFPGPDLAGGGPILYGVVRASTRAPIQSGPLGFARCVGRKGSWSFWPSGLRVSGRSRPRAPAPVRPRAGLPGPGEPSVWAFPGPHRPRARACLGPSAGARARPVQPHGAGPLASLLPARARRPARWALEGARGPRGLPACPRMPANWSRPRARPIAGRGREFEQG